MPTSSRRASSVDEARLQALDPTLDVEAVRAGLDDDPARSAPAAPEAGAIGELPPRGRFRWLVSPRSTVIQMSPVHTGRTADPAATLERLFDCLVRPIGGS